MPYASFFIWAHTCQNELRLIALMGTDLQQVVEGFSTRLWPRV